MTRLIITPAQLKTINEVATNGGEFNTVSDIIDKRSKMPNDITTKNVNFQNSNPNAVDSSVSISKEDLTNADSDDINAIQNSKNVTVTSESRRYSKRQVELGRMLEMRRTGKIYTKKQLNEMFMESEENVSRFEECIGGCNIASVFRAVADVFGSDAESQIKDGFMYGENPMDILRDIFKNADPGKQEEFLGEIGC